MTPTSLTPRRGLRLAGVLLTTTIIGVQGGIPGLAWGLLFAVAVTRFPLPAAIFIGQFGIAATSTTSSLLLVPAELGVLAILTSDLTPAPSQALLAGLTTILATSSLAWVLHDISLAATAVTLLAGLTVLLYGGHRVELLKTQQLHA